MASLTRGLELLESAVSYGLAGAGLVTPQLLARPTPCRGWDLEMLLFHVSDSIETLNEAIVTGHIRLGSTQGRGGREADAVSVLHGRAARLLGACSAARADDRRVAIGERELTQRKVALAGAIEVTIHGWDIRAACGAFRPIPPLLAAMLLPMAPLLITPGARPGLFADPIQLPGPAHPGDQLVAFLGRQPRWTAPPTTA
jgi:uncharacterized protein (TIGR03086 family)